jgi:hypothetical protein
MKNKFKFFVLINALGLGLAMDAMAADSTPSNPARGSTTTCRQFEGSKDIEALTGVVFIGEHHGTKEIPEFVGQMICLAGKTKSVHLAFELPEDWTQPLNDFIASGESPQSLDQFLLQTNWNQSVAKNADGRTSIAIIELLHYVKKLKQAGYNISLSSFDTRGWEAPFTLTDIGMAASLTRAIEKINADVIFVLSGEYHTRLVENTTPAKPQPMAFLVAGARPAWKVQAITVSYSAGALWGCTMTKCGELYQPTTLPLSAPKYEVNATRDKFGYSGDLYVGAISASRPYEKSVLP